MDIAVADTQASPQCHLKRVPAGSKRKYVWSGRLQSEFGPTSAIHHPQTGDTTSFAPTLTSEIWRTGWANGVRQNQMAQALYVLKLR